MAGIVTETFFRPEELARERLAIPAVLYNKCRLMLTRCRYENIFVPVRTMQMQAVIDLREVIFVDNQAYAVRDGEGGRMILLAWQFGHGGPRDSLTEPVPIELVYFHELARELHTRLIGEFRKALEIAANHAKENGCEARNKKVLAFPA
jgi:hypothetical protein